MAPRTASDAARAVPPRVPPGLQATDFAPNPGRGPHYFPPEMNSWAGPEYISFLPGAAAALIVVLYAVLLIAVLNAIK